MPFRFVLQHSVNDIYKPSCDTDKDLLFTFLCFHTPVIILQKDWASWRPVSGYLYHLDGQKEKDCLQFQVPLRGTLIFPFSADEKRTGAIPANLASLSAFGKRLMFPISDNS